MKRRIRLLPWLALSMLATAGCGHSGPMGQVRGTVIGVGGPPGEGFTVQSPLSETQATVTLHGPDGASISTRTGSRGKFRAEAPPGRYTVTGRSSDVLHSDDCSAPGPITVAAGQLTTVTLTCPIP